MKDYEKITKDDLEEFRETFGSSRTIEDMEATILADGPYRSLLHRGRMWGWGDTEVRDEIYLVRHKLPFSTEDWD